MLLKYQELIEEEKKNSKKQKNVDNISKAIAEALLEKDNCTKIYYHR